MKSKFARRPRLVQPENTIDSLREAGFDERLEVTWLCTMKEFRAWRGAERPTNRDCSGSPPHSTFLPPRRGSVSVPGAIATGSSDAFRKRIAPCCSPH